MSTATVVEKPILFSSSMVKAILDGRKTMTRRVIKPQPIAGSGTPLVIQHPAYGGSAVVFRGPDGMDARPKEYQKPGTWVCPYGQPGDHLWVRESFLPCRGTGDKHPVPIGLASYVCFRDGSQKFFGNGCYYQEPPREGPLNWPSDVVWRPSIHMPRWASRITLEVTEVRVQRLTAISSEDAIAEGFSGYGDFLDGFYRINAGRITYADDPFVWCLSFRRLATP